MKPGEDGTQTYSASLQILLIMTVLSLLPAILMTMTSFTRIIVVLAILRQAMGTMQTPSNQILIGLALFTSLFIMTPVFEKAYTAGLEPYMAEEMDFETALTEGIAPFRAFLEERQARQAAGAAVGDSWLFFGDQHRQTDLSLCFPFLDGSVEDAYRYATEVARLDFLGITDHTRDVDRGDVQSQLWWRCAKEVGRHSLGGSFFPYFAFERSHRDTDHNVISLRSDVLRNFPPPLPDYWSEIGGDTFTIPHNPLIGRLWEHHDDAKRPLLEIYQGCRDASLQEGAHRGLDRGYHLGFIASSDHLSTGASFACVWAPRADREAIFRSMKARRTYAATDRIRLVFRSGGHWMGERFASDSAPSFQVEVQGTAALDRMDCYWDGELAESRADLGGGVELKTTWSPRFELTGEHYAYVHVVQADGNQAWSSPIWVRPPE